MIFKSTIFLVGLIFFTSCGVMNNPQTDATLFSSIEKVSEDSTIKTINSEVFVDSAYKIFENNATMEDFIAQLQVDLNDAEFENLQSWIKDLRNVKINFKEKNLLFYPLVEYKNCGIKDEALVSAFNTIDIVLSSTKTECTNEITLYLLTYQIANTISDITIKAFERESVTFSNTKH